MPTLNVCSNEKRRSTGYAVPTMCQHGQGFSLTWILNRSMFPCSVESSVQCFSNAFDLWPRRSFQPFLGLFFSNEPTNRDLVAKKSRYHTRHGKV